MQHMEKKRENRSKMDGMDASANMKTNEESKQNVEGGDAEEGFAEEGFAEEGFAERGDAEQDRGDDRVNAGDEMEYSSDTEEEEVECLTRSNCNFSTMVEKRFEIQSFQMLKVDPKS